MSVCPFLKLTGIPVYRVGEGIPECDAWGVREFRRMFGEFRELDNSADPKSVRLIDSGAIFRTQEQDYNGKFCCVVLVLYIRMARCTQRQVVTPPPGRRAPFQPPLL